MWQQNLVSGSNNNNHNNISHASLNLDMVWLSSLPKIFFCCITLLVLNGQSNHRFGFWSLLFVFQLQSAVNLVVIGLDRHCVNSSSLVNFVRQKFLSPDVTAVRVFAEVLALARQRGFWEARGSRAGEQLNPRPSPITIKAVICDYTAHSAEQRWKLPWKGGGDVRVIKVRKLPWKQGQRWAN